MTLLKYGIVTNRNRLGMNMFERPRYKIILSSELISLGQIRSEQDGQ